MSVLRRGMGSVLRAGGRLAATLAGLAAASAAANWLVIYFMSYAAPRPVEQGGFLWQGGVLLLFGLGFPAAWTAAAWPLATMRAARSFYLSHRDEVLTAVAAAVGDTFGNDDDAGALAARLAGLRRAIVDRQPSVLRPLVRFALRQSRVEELEERIRDGSGPVGTRIAHAVAAQIDDHLDGGALPLQVVAGLNVAAVLGLAVLAS